MWDAYISELKRLGELDNIFIQPVICCNLYNTEAPFPTSTRDKNMAIYCGASLQFKCRVGF